MNKLKSLCIITVFVTFTIFSQSKSPLYLDASQPVELRLKDLMGRMTLEEKV